MIAEVERSTGHHITAISTHAILPLLHGECAKCSKPIEFLNVMLCDDCLPPPDVCQVCGGPGECWSRGDGHMCCEHARTEWGWA